MFAYGGLGRADSSDVGETMALNAGLQADYETRWICSSLKSEWQGSPGQFTHHIQTAQLGFAPYAHDWDVLATWIVLQGRHYTGGLYQGIEPALILRLFKGPVWFEIGANGDGGLQSMLMLNF